MACQSGTSYIVQSGDTLYTIAQQKLGDGNRWREIKNPDGSSPDPSKLYPGEELCLPVAAGGGLADIVPRETFDALFPNRNGLYTYDFLVAASQQYAGFCNEGSLDDRKREAAAFLAHVSHETGALVSDQSTLVMRAQSSKDDGEMTILSLRGSRPWWRRRRS